MLAESEHVSVPTWIRLDFAFAVLAATAAAATVIATQLVLLARLDGLMTFMIAISGQPPAFRNAVPPVGGKLLAPFASDQCLLGAGGAMMPRAK